MSGIRTLSKSDFKLAQTCDAKLFFREHHYPDNRDSDPYLALLARGGYMVEALAKAKHPDGVALEYGGAVQDAAARTLEFLKRDVVTLFEATLLVGRQQARVDILQKQGNVVRLLEVKSKSFDGAEHTRSIAEGGRGTMRRVKAPFAILTDWMAYLQDITFQVLLLEKVLPGVIVKPDLVLVDTSKRSDVDDITSLFAIDERTGADGTKRLNTARFTGTAAQLAMIDLLTEVDVSEEVEMLRTSVQEAAAKFESRLDAPLPVHLTDVVRGGKCASCEFRLDDAAAQSGFTECWGALAAPRPHILELLEVGRAKAPDRSPLVEWMVDHKTTSLLDTPIDGLVTGKGEVGPLAERQRRQIEYTRRNAAYISPSLASKIDALRGPIQFIDFEAARLALPYHRGMRPYGLVAFQWSCHTALSAGGQPTHMEWLNDIDVWPNQKFAESLRGAIGDSGPVLTWSPFEGVTLRQIVAELEKSGRDTAELTAWMRDVADHRIVDLHDWAKSDFYHPGMRGRTSIKVVLDALWQTDPVMREQFERWTGFTADAARDPYSALPPISINGTDVDVHEGTGAMSAYEEMMYGVSRHEPSAQESYGKLLRQYCSLDTLSMVLILEHWRRAVGG